MPTLVQNLQKSFQVPAHEKRNFKNCTNAQVDIENDNKYEKNKKHEGTTLCISNSGLGAILKRKL